MVWKNTWIKMYNDRRIRDSYNEYTKPVVIDTGVEKKKIKIIINMKTLKDCFINEAKQTEYRVCFVGCVNEKTDNLPINVSIFVDNDDVESFEKYLNDEQDNIFAHAEGGNVEY